MVDIFGYDIPEEEGRLEVFLEVFAEQFHEECEPLNEEEKIELEKIKKHLPNMVNEFPIIFKQLDDW